MKEKCILNKCDRPTCARGLCKSCYQTASVAVLAKVTSWEELSSLGLAKPIAKQTGGESKFLAILNQRRAEVKT